MERKFLVFEAGGRAGLSAELFFLARRKKDDGAKLVMADMDAYFRKCPAAPGVVRLGEDKALEMIASDPSSLSVFPADELARQDKKAVFDLASKNPFTAVEPWFFHKHEMNLRLTEITKGCRVRIPETFYLDDVFMRPDTMSAGSNGVAPLRNTCITRRIDIAREYVVDIDWTLDNPRIFAREVRIKNGYDKYLRFVPQGSSFALACEEFVRAIRASEPLLATGVFHIQLIENAEGEIYFVEYSKRISGTSSVNLFRGYNPFDSFAGVETSVRLGGAVREDEWYRFEDLMLNLHTAIQ